ncbi:unnamed protein product, partial [Symbiodinium microadriaticum]
MAEITALNCQRRSEVQALNGEKEAVICNLSKAKQEIEKTAAALSTYETQIEELTQKEAAASNLLKTNEVKYMKRAVASAALRNQLDAAESTMAEHEKSIASLTASNAALSQEVKTLQCAAESSISKEASIQHQLDKAYIELSGAKDIKSQLEREVSKLSHDLEAANSKISDVFTDKNELGTKLNTAIDRISQLSVDLNLSTTELASVKVDYEQSKTQLHEKIELIRELSKQLKVQEENMTTLQSENYRHLKSAMELKETVLALRAQVADLMEAKQKLGQELERGGAEAKRAELHNIQAQLQIKIEVHSYTL